MDSTTCGLIETDTVEAMLEVEVYCDEMASGVAAASRGEVERAGRSNSGLTNTEDCSRTCGGCRG
jgi:hypothetical protein